MKHLAFPDGLTRQTLIEQFRTGRARSVEVFSLVTADAYYERPIALRNPVVFYEGHLPAFTVNTLLKLALGRPGLDEQFEILFARGIDPADEAAARTPSDLWPSRPAVQAYGQAADRLIEETLATAELENDDVPELRDGEAVLAILEHELMHQETLLYMFHNLPYERKIPRPPLSPALPREEEGDEHRPPKEMVYIPRGFATLGAEREEIGFGWDNESPAARVEVPAFEIDRYDITNAQFREFVQAGGYRDASFWSDSAWRWIATTGIRHPWFWAERGGQWFWRGMFKLIPIPPEWPVYVSHAEAEAYARWKGLRLPNESEYHRAAFSTPSGEERSYPWGEELPDSTRGNFDFANWDPVPVGSYPEGASAWGVHDLVGNGWEWTSTPFAGFPGFTPMPSYQVYSAEFFDGGHYVLKGASPATAKELVRRSFRNWFRPTYPYVYATFRCARDAA